MKQKLVDMIQVTVWLHTDEFFFLVLQKRYIEKFTEKTRTNNTFFYQLKKKYQTLMNH